VTAYSEDMEPALAKKHSKIVRSFQELSRRIGKEKTIWRYDPIVITEKYDIDFHEEQFSKLAYKLSDYTEKCIISFIDLYKTAKKNKHRLGLKEMTKNEIFNVAERFSRIANRYDIKLETCSEKVDLSRFDIDHASCVDAELIERITGDRDFNHTKDKNQRLECGCIESIDIGAYNSCVNRCSYCYANYNETIIQRNVEKHSEDSPILIGELSKDVKIYDKSPDKTRQLKWNL